MSRRLPCMACDDLPEGRICAPCWKEMKRTNLCPVCFTALKVKRLDDGFRLRVHPDTACKVANFHWHDRVSKGRATRIRLCTEGYEGGVARITLEPEPVQHG